MILFSKKANKEGRKDEKGMQGKKEKERVMKT